ncbi:hypothetical protein [Gemmatimonas sp.]
MPTLRAPVAAALFVALAAAPQSLSAQPAKPRSPTGAPAARTAPARAGEGIAGSYAGTATVQLGDSTIVVPVNYVFTGTAPAIGGTAMVPGQGTGTISNVQREGARLRFRVTAGEGKLLEHDGTIAASGNIEGFVNLDGLPVAKFRIAPAPRR